MNFNQNLSIFYLIIVLMAMFVSNVTCSKSDRDDMIEPKRSVS